MIIKQCQFSGQDDQGTYVHLLHAGYDNSHLIKEAQSDPRILGDIQRAVRSIPKSNNTTLVLVSAMGAGEYRGSNTNGDYFPEESLIHVPKNWLDLPLSMQQNTGRSWEWGYPTFYNAHAFQHHVNKDPARAFGNVEYACWDELMKRILLIVSIDHAKAKLLGATGVIDRIEGGQFPDVSMGCRVPYDLCTICADWARITGNPKRDLAEHRRRAIRGLSETRNDYCQHLKFELNKIYPNGKKVAMINLHPRFFDISFVFIGADKTSKVMAKLAAGLCPIREGSKICPGGCTKCSSAYAIPSSHVYEVWDKKKVAASTDLWVPPEEENKVRRYFDRKRKLSAALNKKAEIVKQVRSNFSKALPSLECEEKELPRDILSDMSKDMPGALRTSGSLGIILKPREFQRIFISSAGRPDIADDLESRGICFRPGGSPTGAPMLGRLIPELIRALAPSIATRSCLGPPLHKRIIRVRIDIHRKPDECSMDDPFLDKVSSAYADYRKQLLYKAASIVPAVVEEHPWLLEYLHPDQFEQAFTGGGIAKSGGDVMKSLVGMFPSLYFNRAYLNEPVSKYVDEHPDFDGISAASTLAVSGGVA